MSSKIDMSLDDIIKQNRVGSFKQKLVTTKGNQGFNKQTTRNFKQFRGLVNKKIISGSSSYNYNKRVVPLMNTKVQQQGDHQWRGNTKQTFASQSLTKAKRTLRNQLQNQRLSRANVVNAKRGFQPSNANVQNYKGVNRRPWMQQQQGIRQFRQQGNLRQQGTRFAQQGARFARQGTRFAQQRNWNKVPMQSQQQQGKRPWKQQPTQIQPQQQRRFKLNRSFVNHAQNRRQEMSRNSNTVLTVSLPNNTLQQNMSRQRGQSQQSSDVLVEVKMPAKRRQWRKKPAHSNGSRQFGAIRSPLGVQTVGNSGASSANFNQPSSNVQLNLMESKTSMSLNDRFSGPSRSSSGVNARTRQVHF